MTNPSVGATHGERNRRAAAMTEARHHVAGTERIKPLDRDERPYEAEEGQ